VYTHDDIIVMMVMMMIIIIIIITTTTTTIIITHTPSLATRSRKEHKGLGGASCGFFDAKS